MSLIVEDGSGLPDAESYASVTMADTYHTSRGNADWALLSTQEKEVALRRATDFMVQLYRQQWKGARLLATQTLDWPRGGVLLDDVGYAGYPADVANDIVPTEVINACVSLSLTSTTTDLSPPVDRVTKREKVGALEVEYETGSRPYTSYRAINNMLAIYLDGGFVGGATLRVIRA